MALSLKLSLQQLAGCRGFKLYEITGEYDDSHDDAADNNLGGWGSPNPDIVDVDSAILKITIPDDTVFTLDVTNDFNATFPTVDDTDSISIVNTDLGLADTATLPYGIYKIEYLVYDISGNIIATNTQYFLIDCALKCCLDKLLGLLDLCDCCDDLGARNRSLRIRMAYLYLAAADAAVGCGKFSRAEALLDFVNEICTGQNCQCN